MGVLARSPDSLLWMLSNAAPGEPGAGTVAQTAAPRSDLELVRLILARDRKAIADFVAEHTDALYGYVRFRMAPRFEAVDDIMQDVFVAAWQRLETYRGESPLRVWLLGIARHKIEDVYRKRLREHVPLPDDGEPEQATCLDVGLDEGIDRDRLHERASDVLGELPEDYGTVLLWRYWEGISAAEMAAKSGKTEKAIERLLSRARDAFRKRWEDGRR
jgi:RNA polymerase sigma-70 factor, ECF subfamily